MKSEEQLKSRIISFLRFPLIVFVVFDHARITNVSMCGVEVFDLTQFPIYSAISYFISEIMCIISVPMFFMFSGYLFFKNYENSSVAWYKEKYKRRIKTLLFPYIIWNIMILLLFFLAQTFLPDLMSGNHKLIKNYDFKDFLLIFWDTSKINPTGDGFYPICFQLWYIRDLMIVTLFSPLLLYFIKRSGAMISIIFLILWIIGVEINIVGLNIEAITFYSLGVYLAINKISIIKVERYWLICFMLYIITSIVVYIMRTSIYYEMILNLNVIFGIIAIVSITAHLLLKNKSEIGKKINEYVFFIYAYHAMFLAFVVKIITRIVAPNTELSIILTYFFCPIFVIFVGVILCKVLRKCYPKVLGVMLGGR